MSKVVYEGLMVRYGRRKIGRSYIHMRYFVLESQLIAYYKRKPQDNVVPIKTLLIDGNCRVEDLGLKTQHGHVVNILPLKGIARGIGWQHIGAYVNLGAYYVVGIPVALVFGFVVHLGGKGLWMGFLLGSLVQCILLSVLTSFTDWQQQARKARERIFEGRFLLSNTS